MSARKVLFILLALLALGATTGCATGFLYDRADRFAHRYVGAHLELEPAQQTLFEAHLAELHGWHRREQLPAYAGWLRGLAARFEGPAPFSEAELRVLGTELGAFWREFASAGLPLLTGLGATLEDSQADALVESLRAERRREAQAAARRDAAWQQARRARSMERFLRRFTGPLSDEQRLAIRAWARTLEPSREQADENRDGWIGDLEAALARRNDADELAAAAEVLFVMPAQRWPPDYQALVERNSTKTLDFLAGFLNRLEPRQRDRAIQRLERLAGELAQLAAAAG